MVVWVSGYGVVTDTGKTTYWKQFNKALYQFVGETHSHERRRSACYRLLTGKLFHMKSMCKDMKCHSLLTLSSMPTLSQSYTTKVIFPPSATRSTPSPTVHVKFHVGLRLVLITSLL